MEKTQPETPALYGLRSPWFSEVLGLAIADLDRYCGVLLDTYTFPQDSGISLHIRDRTSVNAGASWNEESRYFEVGLNVGLCVWAYEAAVWMTWFNANDEEDLPFRAKRLRIFGKGTSKRQLQARLLLADSVYEESDSGFCQYLFFTILLSVFLHEVAHILRGHVDYVRSEQQDGVGLIDELEAWSGETAYHLSVPIRSIEFEADRHGASLLAEFARDHAHSSDRWRYQTETHNLTFALFGFALFSVALAEIVADAGSEPDRYPSALMRFSIVLSSIAAVWRNENRGDVFNEEVVGKVFPLLAVYERLYPGIDRFRAFNEEAWLSKIFNEVDAITAEFAESEPVLQPHRFDRLG